MIPAKRIQIAFGKAVRKHREAAGLSQEQLSELAGIHRTYIGDVERGERNLGLVNLYRITDALRVKLSVLAADAEAFLKR